MNTEINIYGTADCAIKFVLLNKDVKVKAFIDSNTNKKKFLPELFNNDVPIIDSKQAADALKKRYTVVAASVDAYWQIREYLETVYGLNEYIDFEPYTTFRKKIAVIYGNCHTAPIRQVLQCSKEFSSVYGIYPMPLIQNVASSSFTTNDFPVFEKTDLFVHQYVRRENVFGLSFSSEHILKKLPQKCKVISIPNLYRMPKFLFPQWDGTFEKFSYGVFSFNDKFIDGNIHLGFKELLHYITDINLLKKQDILNGRDAFLDSVLEREKQWDIKIFDFLKNNYYGGRTVL